MKLNEDAQKNLAASANAYDIDPSRLVFATRVPRIQDHLARYRLADICLDTFPYNGHTTTSDAILAGVPVVTLAGQGFASRVAASLLSDAEKKESVSSSLKAYAETVRAHLEETTRTNGVSEWSVTEQEQADGFAAALDSIE
jgi:predicted O-linked N-acetylglucosamine transferase (SPINDLY family)